MKQTEPNSFLLYLHLLLRVGGKLLSIRMTEDAALYAIASQDNAIRIFDSITLEAVRVLSGIMQGLGTFVGKYE